MMISDTNPRAAFYTMTALIFAPRNVLLFFENTGKETSGRIDVFTSVKKTGGDFDTAVCFL